jgi:hypothetical protein
MDAILNAIITIYGLSGVPVNLTTSPGLHLLLVPRRVEVHSEWGGCERCNKRHDYKDGKRPGAQNLGIQSDILSTSALLQRRFSSTYQHDQLDKSLATHQRANREAFTPEHLC